MLSAVREYIGRHRLLGPGDRVVAACSGGPDSLALVDVLDRLRGDGGFWLAVAHVNHLLRGAESDADAAFVREFAGARGLEYFETSVDAAAFAAGRSLMDAARILRYGYLRQVSGDLGGALVATGHHSDDQAETVLLNLFRGAGGAGLGGMKPAGDGIIRPLLGVGRGDIEAYCREHGLAPRLDSSNLKTDYQRNLLRLEFMPELARAFNANLAGTLCRTAEIVGDEHDYVSGEARRLFPELVREEGDGLSVACDALGSLHVALRREVIRQALAKKRGGLKGISFLHVEELLKLAACGGTGGAVELPGPLAVRKEYGRLVLAEAAPAAAAAVGPPGIAVAVPGRTPVPALGLTVAARLTDERPDAGPRSAVFDWDALVPPIFVRTRQAGDRFQPAGLSGSKKVKDYFIDCKVPRRQRDNVPVFADGGGIIWLGGLRPAQRGRPHAGTARYLQLRIEQQEELG